MKNSRKSQIAVLIVLAISLVINFWVVYQRRHCIWYYYSYGGVLTEVMYYVWQYAWYALLLITIFAIIYCLVLFEKKIISIVLSIVAIVADIAVTDIYVSFYNYGWRLFKRISIIKIPIRDHVYYGGTFFAILIIFVALLIAFAKSEKTVQNEKEKDNHAKSDERETYNYTKPDTMVSNKIYCSLLKHILLLVFTCGIWYLIWIYRMTEYTNAAEGEEYRNPTKKLLLCMFVPFYSIYWTYKTAQRVDKMAAVKGVSSDMTTLCLILAIFVAIIPPILLQDVINEKPNPPAMLGRIG